MMLSRTVIVGAIMSVALAEPATAQVPGTLLPVGSAEFGITYQETRRDVEFKDKQQEYLWSTWLASVRFGITESMTASAELSGGLGALKDDDLTYLVGAAIQTRVWMHERTVVSTSAGYKRSLIVIRSAAGCDHLEYRLDWNILVERAVLAGEQSLSLWAGPAVSYLAVEAQAPCDEDAWASSRLLGAIAGGYFVFKRHFVLTAQATWIGSIEPVFTLAYRF